MIAKDDIVVFGVHSYAGFGFVELVVPRGSYTVGLETVSCLLVYYESAERKLYLRYECTD
jgi:hypothetical protein